MSKNILAMFGIVDQTLSRGAANASFTQTRTVGVERAVQTLFDAMLTARGAAQPADPRTEFDRLRPDTLVPLAGEKLASIEELVEPQLDINDLVARAATLRDLPISVSSRVAVDANRLVLSVVQDVADDIRAALTALFEAAPEEARSLSPQLRSVLQSIKTMPPGTEAIAGFRRILRNAQELQARRASVPAASFEAVMGRLLQRAAKAYDKALLESAERMVTEILRHVITELGAFLDELSRRCAEYQRRIDLVRTWLGDREKQASERNRISRASVILALDGPDEDQVLTGLMERERCRDINHLASIMLPRFEQSLRDYARAHCPSVPYADASLTMLILAVDPEQAASQFVRLVESRLGSGHSLYELIEKRGVESVCRYLYDRAEHTCHLSERNREHFNVPTAEITIVRLPPPVGPRDGVIRQSLQAAFESMPDCLVTDGSPTEHAVTVIRMEMGWPIGIENANRALLERYVEAAAQGHLPHLLDILPGSPFGEPCAEYRQLVP